MVRFLILLVVCAVGGWATAREWADAEGRFLLHGDAFATNEDTVVIQKPDGDLVGIRISELSEADQEFLRQREQERQRQLQQEAEQRPEEAAPRPALPAGPPSPAGQTWTSRDGHELRGHAIGFGQREVIIARMGRLISVNGVAFSNLDPISRYVVLQIVAEYDDPTVKDEQDLQEWVRKQRGQPRAFLVEGVLLRVEDGRKVPVPFFLFSDQDLSILRPGWEQWKHEQASDTDRQREDFLMTVQARQYQAEREQARQVQIMQTQLLAAATGLTTIWEVQLLPAPGVFARPLSVMVSARDSQQAQLMASARFPGYVSGAVRSVTR